MSELDNDTPVEIDDTVLDEVSGGPIYIFETLTSQVTSSKPSASLGAHVALGDGSVRVG